MRNLNRNRRTVYYALRTGETPNYDEYGNETSESTPTYSAVSELKCNVSAAVGSEEMQAFGSFTGYTRVLCVTDTNCPIKEDSIVWFGVDPKEGEHNYIVIRKADSKNGILYALQEVTTK